MDDASRFGAGRPRSSSGAYLGIPLAGTPEATRVAWAITIEHGRTEELLARHSETPRIQRRW